MPGYTGTSYNELGDYLASDSPVPIEEINFQGFRNSK